MAGSAPADGELDLRPLAPPDVPLALADHHRATAVGAAVRVRLPPGGGVEWAADQLVGGGYDVVEVLPARGRRVLTVRAVRARTLPDYVGAGMRLLFCGLNPSLFAADAGFGFARPGNRFWPAVLAAGLTAIDRDPRRLLIDGHIGMTDLVKRATPRADALSIDEYRAGVARVHRRCAALAPAAVCVVGFDGWRKAVDRRAGPGWQPDGLGGCPVYLMPNTSGLNAHTTLAGFVEHLRRSCDPPALGACS